MDATTSHLSGGSEGLRIDWLFCGIDAQLENHRLVSAVIGDRETCAPV